MPVWLTLPTLLAALGCGLLGGLFFAFSNFVMRALARIAPESGVAAMQAINVTVLNPLFLGIFLGTAVLAFVLVAAGYLNRGVPGTSQSVVGGLLYLLGAFLVTVAFNVPLNDRLAAAVPTRGAGAEL